MFHSRHTLKALNLIVIKIFDESRIVMKEEYIHGIQFFGNSKYTFI